MNDQQVSLLTNDDIYLFNEGTHLRLYDHLGSHLTTVDGRSGVTFAVWAPDATEVSVVGDSNGWSKGANRLSARASSGIWEGFIEGMVQGDVYKYHIVSRHDGYAVDKADPYAVFAEVPPKTASKVWNLDYAWGDGEWMASRPQRQGLDKPAAIHEMHFGSWRHVPEEGDRPLTYREMAKPLAEYLKRLGFTHVEFLPLMEHPFAGSWGYQTTGYFAATS